jgi:hypothetical protein
MQQQQQQQQRCLRHHLALIITMHMGDPVSLQSPPDVFGQSYQDLA